MRLKITFKRAAGETNLYKTPYFNSKTKITINENEIGRELQTSEQEILNGIAVWLSEGSDWTVVSINDHYINTVVYNPLKGSSYIKLPPELQQFDINVIPNNMEKYMAFMLGKHLVFLDSLQFMSSCLDKQVSNLPKEGFKYTSEIFKNEQFALMRQKGVYP